MPATRCGPEALEHRFEERPVRRARAKIQNKSLEPVGEQADAGDRLCQLLDAKALHRIRLGQEARRVEIFAMLGPRQHTPSSLASSCRHDGPITDLTDGSSKVVQDRHEQRAGKVIYVAAFVRRSSVESGTRRCSSVPDNLASPPKIVGSLRQQFTRHFDQERARELGPAACALRRTRPIGESGDQDLRAGQRSPHPAGEGILAQRTRLHVRSADGRRRGPGPSDRHSTLAQPFGVVSGLGRSSRSPLGCARRRRASSTATGTAHGTSSRAV